jgi:hypothetical protein
VFELSLGVYLIVKGFKPTPLTTGHRSTGNDYPETQTTVQP